MKIQFKPSNRVWLMMIAVAIYAIFSLVYFSPQLGGGVLQQHDVVQYKGMVRDVSEHRVEYGEDPQWNGSMFGGMPANMISLGFPSQKLQTYRYKLRKMFPAPASATFLAMTMMFAMLMIMGVSPAVAIVGGLMYGLSTYFFLILDAGHMNKVWALCSAPLMFGGCYMLLRGSLWHGFVVTSFFTWLQLATNHVQITYYFVLVMFAYWLFMLYRAVVEKCVRVFAKRSLLLGLAGLLGLMANFSPLWYNAQYSKETMRGGSHMVTEGEGKSGKGLDLSYATAWSYGRMESMNLFIPGFTGGASGEPFSKTGEVAKALRPYGAEQIAQQLPTYWGEQPFTSGPQYIGAVVFMMAVFAMFALPRRKWGWLLGVCVFALFLAWGHHMMWFTELAFKILPAYNKFRAVSTTLVIIAWAMPLLACYGMMTLYDKKLSQKELQLALLQTMCLCGGVAIFFSLFGGVILDFGRDAAYSMLVGASFPANIANVVADAMVSERLLILKSDAWRTIFFVLAMGGVSYLAIKEKINRNVMVALFGVLTLMDVAGVNWRYVNHDSFYPKNNVEVLPTAADLEVMQDKELGYRVLDLRRSPFSDATASFFHRSIGGYNGAKLSRYQDLIDAYLRHGDAAALDMLNVKYTIDREGVTLRETANSAAWFVEDIYVAQSPNEEMRALAHIDNKRAAVVERTQNIGSRKGMSRGEVSLDDYKLNHMTYSYSAENDGVIIFSEIFYDKGWRAFIDGEEVPYFRANYLLRGLEVPAGEHTVEWKYRLPQWSLIEGFTFAMHMIIILLVVASLVHSAIKFYNERRENIKA